MAPTNDPAAPDASPEDGSEAPRRALPRGGPSAEEKTRLRNQLLSLHSNLLRSNRDLASEALKGSGQVFSVDHLADQASDNTDQAISISLLESETDLLKAIETAILKIDGQAELPYGVCETCALRGDWDPETPAPWIPTGRLGVVPYAHLCIAHQEEQEES
jgi:RNA polymerase-binding transcription factor DksA